MPLSEEQRRARRREQNARYYAAHRDAVLARVKANPQPYRARRTAATTRRLRDLRPVLHPELQHFVDVLFSIGADRHLYPSEVGTIEDLLVIINTAWETTPRTE